MMQLVFQLVLLVTAVAFTSAAPRDKKLQILSLSAHELRALYHTSSDEGIELLSEVSDKFHHLSINTLDGTQLVSARSSSDTGAAVWKIMDSTILLHSSGGKEERAGIMEYAVPSAFTARLEKEMKRNNYISKKLLNSLDTASTAEVKHSAFSKLLSRPEMDTIIEMAHALGAAGVYGHENQPALNFYGLALNYDKMRSPPRVREPVLPPHLKLREPGGTLTCTTPGWFYGEYEDHCKRCPLDDEYCTGMCGNTCYCWWFLCGDCCYHQGCYEHDLCCTGGWIYLNMKCIYPFPFDCDDYKHKC